MGLEPGPPCADLAREIVGVTSKGGAKTQPDGVGHECLRFSAGVEFGAHGAIALACGQVLE
jgi:hypothetical protein